jgi:hypothetical protein
MKFNNLMLVAVISAAAATAGAAFSVSPKTTTSTSAKTLRRTRALSIQMVEHGTASEGATLEQTTDTKQDATKETFVNDGLFSFMQNFLTLHEDGKSMAYGIPVAADESRRSSPEKVAAEREEYAKKLMNIGMEERERRRNAGETFQVVTAVYICWAALIDQGDFTGHILRFLVVLPLFFAVGYRLSADEGI